jgi:AcrR family transcriptional regulator
MSNLVATCSVVSSPLRCTLARALSEAKYEAILTAAMEIIAEVGLAASTAQIAKVAKIADGSLFTYFPTKDALLNTLYLTIKTEIATAMLSDYPARASTIERARHVWRSYVLWGVSNPGKRKVIAQLSVSNRLTVETRTASMKPLMEIEELLAQCIKGSSVTVAFALAMMSALIETTMAFMVAEPKQADRHAESGFRAFWRAIEAT